jgi:hypothetical protein
MKKIKLTLKKRKITQQYFLFFIVLLLFFPAKNINLYHALIVAYLGFGFFLIDKKLTIGKEVLLLLFFIFLVSFSALWSSIYFLNDPLRNLSEVFRFFPVLMVLMIFGRSHFFYDSLFLKAILFYSFLVFLVCWLQFFDADFISPVTRFYSSDNHIELSLGVSSRALGLSQGPGQNASLMAVIYAISLGQLVRKVNVFAWFFVTIFSGLSIFMSQSQTGFIVLLGVTLYCLFYVFIKWRIFGSKSTFSSFFLLFLGGSGVLLYFVDQLSYLFTLFTHGLARSSFQNRVSKSSDIFFDVIDNPFFLMLGHGKDFFGPISGTMDNEWLFYLSVYGFLPLSMIVLFYLFVVFQSLFKGRQFFERKPYYVSLSFVVVAGVVLAYPTSFILDPRVLLLLSILSASAISDQGGRSSKSI